MKPKTANLVAHLLWPGLLAACVFGDRKRCSFYLKQCLGLNVIATVLFFLNRLTLPGILEMFVVLAHIALAAGWGYSFMGAALGREYRLFPFSTRDGLQFMQDMKAVFGSR